MIKMLKNFALVNIFILLVNINVAYAADSAQKDPIVTLEDITDSVLYTLKENKAKIDKNPEKIYDIVNTVIVPHIDFVEISRWITGKKVWRSSSQPLKDSFIKELRTVVVKTYAISLHNYSDEKIIFYPLKNHNAKLKKRMQVSSKIVSSKKQDIHIDFRIISSGLSWKVYDIVVEGVSLLKGLQAQFTDMIKKEGLDKVVIKMRNNSVKIEKNDFSKQLKSISLNTDLILLKSNEASRE